jgi:hypothetical protein
MFPRLDYSRVFLLLVVNRGANEPLARRISPGRSHRAAFAIGGDDDATAGGHFAAFLDVESQRTIVDLCKRPGHLNSDRRSPGSLKGTYRDESLPAPVLLRERTWLFFGVFAGYIKYQQSASIV